MRIEKIIELRNAGVWRSFTAPSDVSLAARTLIFGFNGSGKTTLSRVFSSIQRGVLEDRLPPETSFKVLTSDSTTITQDSLSDPFDNNLLVFNTDFIARNFEWDASSSKGIAYLSEKKIDARKEYEEISPKLAAARLKSKGHETALKKAEKELSDFKTRVARNIREAAASSVYTQSYDARKIQSHYSKASYGQIHRLSDEELKKLQEVLAMREPLPEIGFTTKLPDGLLSWFSTSLELLRQPISVLAMKEFEEHSEALRWIEQGLHYHDKNGVSECLLCGNAFSEERRRVLRNLFDSSWNGALTAVDESLKRGQLQRQALRDFYRSIPKESEVSVEHRPGFSETRSLLANAIEKLGFRIGELFECLEERAGNPTKEIILPDGLKSFDPKEWSEQYAEIESSISSLLKGHNDAVKNFSLLQRGAFAKIEAHVLSTNQNEWNRIQKSVMDEGASKEDALGTVRALSDRQLELRNALEDRGVAADKMNELIWAYLGHKEIRLVAEDGGYKIVRPGGRPAKELSEGERTAVAFCYFLTQLAAEGRKAENLVLVIDDPISSLDTAARTYAYSLMTRMTKKCSQVILLTHNTSFMNMVKREFQNLCKRDATKWDMALLTLDCRTSGSTGDRETALTHMHPLLVNYSSEYHYLFNLVQKAGQSQATDQLFLLPNATRKLLEMFSTFCSPGKPSFAEALMDHHDAVKDRLDVRALERLVQIESHGTMEGLNSLPELTLEEALRAAKSSIEFIKEVGKDHYKKMMQVCT